jgi:small subunit ribosomal protein S21
MSRQRYKEKEFDGSTVEVRNDDVNSALRVFKKKIQNSGIIQEIRERQFYESKGTKRRKDKAAATRRFKRKMQKRLEEKGY